MALTELTIRLLLLFFPGSVCHGLTDLLTVHKERKPFHVFLLTYVFGIASYCLYAVGVSLANIRASDGAVHIKYDGCVGFFKTLTDQKANLDFSEIIWVTLTAVALGLLLSTAQNRYWLHDFARWARITSRFGQPNVWSFALNAKEIRWATVRDLKHNLMFQGYLRAFSDVEDTKELLLLDVIVYDEKTGADLYTAEYLYLARPGDDLTVQFQTVQ